MMNIKTIAALDARWFQLVFLASLLIFGAWLRDFSLTWPQVVLTFFSGLATQWAWQCVLDGPRGLRWSQLLSPLVSCCGICILVRADNLWAHGLLACLAISSKYVLRVGSGANRGHVLNPANLAAYLAGFWLPGTWMSAGQWGAKPLVALWFLALGGIVTRRVQRIDIGLSFLLSWSVLLAARLLLLGYAWTPGAAMWLQQCSNGAVLLFAFFMISDPMTTPQQRSARIAYSVCVATIAVYWQFVLYRPHGLVSALFMLSWTVPFWNRVWPGQRFSWAGAVEPTAGRRPLPAQPGPPVYDTDGSMPTISTRRRRSIAQAHSLPTRCHRAKQNLGTARLQTVAVQEHIDR